MTIYELSYTTGFIILSIMTLGMVFAKLYKRASKETSFVRTGVGGEKIILNSGAMVLPILHEIIPVNMNTLRLLVQRDSEHALITRDRMRVDVVAEFYVRVKPTIESISNAAQTLGRRTMVPETLKELMEGKFVDALRAVAAEMSMEELHEKRVDFVQKVQQVVTEDLLKNGLELETVSLTGLDQTSREYFNPDNAFDAEGLTRLTHEIERRKKIRNDIEQDTIVQIKSKNLESEKRALEIEREEEYARLEQQRELEIRRAEQASDVARQQALNKQEAEQAAISAHQEVELSKIASQRITEEHQIEKERQIEEREIARQKSIETQNIEKQQSIALAQQIKQIAITEKSKEESLANALADEALAKAVAANERVATVREKEIAERSKIIELINASKEAERDAIGIKVSAEAEKLSAFDKAEAIREQARAEADKYSIIATGEAEAEKLRAEAARLRYAVDAEGERGLNESANLLSQDQVTMRVKMELINKLEAIMRECVKPLENIEGIKILSVNGLLGNTVQPSGSDAHATSHSLSDEIVNSALKFRAQAPLIDSLLHEVGLKGMDLKSVSDLVKSTEPA